MSKPSIFISHITEEKKLAFALKETISHSILGMADIFVSSDPNDLPAGKQWYKEIKERLEECSLLFLFCSPQSVRRLWIGYEAGAGSIRGIPVIPVCHSEMSFESLPAPLSLHQAVDASNPESMSLIIPTIAKALGSDKPEIDFTKFTNVVKAHESENQLFKSNGISIDNLLNGVLDEEMPQYVEQCLWSISELYDGGPVSVSSLKEEMRQMSRNKTAVNLAIRYLERLGLIETWLDSTEYNNEEFQVCSITPEGWDYLRNNVKEEYITLRPPSPVDSFYGVPF